MATRDEYSAAFDVLDQRHESGAMSDGEYLVWRDRLVREMRAEVPTWLRVRRAMVWVAVLILVGLALVMCTAPRL